MAKYKMVFKNSIDLYKKAVELIPGGVNNPMRAFKSVNKETPIFIKKGQGAKIWDEDDNEYSVMERPATDDAGSPARRRGPSHRQPD